MQMRLTLITCCALLLSAPVLRAGQPYLVTEQSLGNIWRIQDVNDDGDALDVGERTLWGDGFAQALGLEPFGGAVFATDVESPFGPPNDKIVRLVDLNGDGDALDIGERSVWAAGLNQPVGLLPDGTGGFYVSEYIGSEVLHLVDSNGDGDALDVGEQRTFADDLGGVSFLFPTGAGMLASSIATNKFFLLEDNNGDGDALDVAEKTLVLDSVGGSLGALDDGNGGFYFTAALDATVYHAQDKNGDGDYFDVAEVLSYADNVFGGLQFPWTMAEHADGGFLLVDRAAALVRWVRDENGDGDALDLGEVSVFADGFSSNPWDIILLPELVPDADFDGDGDVDGTDFLTWQRNYSLTGQTNNSSGDANFDGIVNRADLDVWEAQYGTVPTLAAVQTVPEPAGAMLFTLTAWFVFWLKPKEKVSTNALSQKSV